MPNTSSNGNQRLYQQAADKIVQLMREGDYARGAKLPGERDLARLLKVSRTTVREALIALEISGHVGVRVGSGAYVREPAQRIVENPSWEDIGAGAFELVAARKLIEPPVAAAAAHSITEVELKGVHETLAMIEKKKRDHWEKLEVDRLFHLRIAEATHNAVLVETVASLWKQMFGPIFALLAERTQLTNRQSMTFADHRAIYGCLQRRDAAAAHAAMLSHLVNVELTLMHGEDEN